MRIQQLGVIEDALLELDQGFTAVTGETGAGKTMVISGLHLLSGGRSDSSKVPAGGGGAREEGRFGPREGGGSEGDLGDAWGERDAAGGANEPLSGGNDG